MTTSSTTLWTVGHDGSHGASNAAKWAVTQAAERDVELVLVRSWQIPAVDVPLPVESIEDFAPTEVSEDFEEFVATARTSGVSVSPRIVCGPPAQTLLDQSELGEVLVVGSRGLGGFRRLLLGSVSSQCATHAQVPTIVVPDAAVIDRPISRIVVGLDGSDRSRRALDWAIGFAPDGCAISVVGAWMPSKSGFTAVAEHYGRELDHARDRFDEIVGGFEIASGERKFERRFAFADPATTLLDEASGADLVVVGKRGHSGLSAAILGSVSTHVLHHSPIPVAVIPDEH